MPNDTRRRNYVAKHQWQRGGVHEKTNKAKRQKDKQALKRQIRAGKSSSDFLLSLCFSPVVIMSLESKRGDTMLRHFSILLLFMSIFACQEQADDMSKEINKLKQKTKLISHFPKTLYKDCQDGMAKVYDECGDQTEILAKAIKKAQEDNKLVLVIYGNEWCIWCHVVKSYIQGNIQKHHYKWRYHDGEVLDWDMREEITKADLADALALNHFVADNFVIASIEGDYTNGSEAVAMTGYDPNQIHYYPFIFILNRKGEYVSHLSSSSVIKGLEVRESGGEEYRGYNRPILLDLFKDLKAKAI